ncbi:MAG TPA: MFS transporter [Verrucomicrobiae bacterium]|jgi:MFS family permease|nr:MFS transporter [Verrucomicrobiae bacterium]
MITPSPDAKADAASSSAVRGFLGKFAVLRGAIPELWIVFALKFLIYAAYAVTNSTLVLWLRSDLGYTDKQALPLVAAWSLLMTISTLLVGSLTDALGMRRTLFLGTYVCIIARFVLVATTVRWAALGLGLAPLAVGEALSGPVMIAAVQKYSNTRQRSISFSLIYTVMNGGSLVAAWIFDWVRQRQGEYGHLNLPGGSISTYRTLLLVSLIIEIGMLPLIVLMRDGVEASDEGVKKSPDRPRYLNRSIFDAIGLTIQNAIRETFQLFARLVKQAGFYRLLAFLMLIAFLKLIFMQMYYVFPTFGIRELGPGAPVGRLWATNSLIVIFLVPLVGALTQRFSAYTMVIVGGLISAGSVFIMTMPTTWFVSSANGWVGNVVGHWYLNLKDGVHPYYVMIMLFVVLLSVGEAFYSPRVYEYAAAIAPKGQEASYGALAYVPFFLAKVLIGTFSGVLLARYCPPTGPRHSQTLWLMVGLTSLIAPVGLIGLRKVIRVREAGREE